MDDHFIHAYKVVVISICIGGKSNEVSVHTLVHIIGKRYKIAHIPVLVVV